MQRVLLPVASLLFFISLPASAATAKKNKKVESEAATMEDNSEQNRARQKGGAELLYTPASDFVLSYGVGGHIAMNPKLQLGVSYLSGNKSLDLSESSATGTTKGSATINGMAVTAYGRYFFGNSFNMFSGLNYRTASIAYSIQDSSGLSVDGKLDIQSITIPVFIGNMWTWGSGFTLGVDWVGLFVPISGSAKSSTTGNLGTDTMKDLNKSFVETGDRLAHGTSLTLLLTTLGWAF